MTADSCTRQRCPVPEEDRVRSDLHDDPLKAAAQAIVDGATPHEYARQPCEHGMRYRGTGRSCGYCLAMADVAEPAVALARDWAAEAPLPRDTP